MTTRVSGEDSPLRVLEMKSVTYPTSVGPERRTEWGRGSSCRCRSRQSVSCVTSRHWLALPALLLQGKIRQRLPMCCGAIMLVDGAPCGLGNRPRNGSDGRSSRLAIGVCDAGIRRQPRPGMAGQSSCRMGDGVRGQSRLRVAHQTGFGFGPEARRDSSVDRPVDSPRQGPTRSLGVVRCRDEAASPAQTGSSRPLSECGGRTDWVV
jgi:hypothetical protein